MREKELYIACLSVSDEEKKRLRCYSLFEIKRRYPNSVERYRQIIEAYDRHLGITFHADQDYPQCLMESGSGPYCLFYMGTLPSHGLDLVATIGGESVDVGANRAAFLFALEAGANGASLITDTGSPLSYSILSGLFEGGGRGYIATPSGVLRPGGFSRLMRYRCVTSGGAVIGTVLPQDGASWFSHRSQASLLALLSFCVVVFSSTLREKGYEVAQLALDEGKDVFVHRSAIGSPGGNALIRDGAMMVDSFVSLLHYYGKAETQILYRNERKSSFTYHDEGFSLFPRE